MNINSELSAPSIEEQIVQDVSTKFNKNWILKIAASIIVLVIVIISWTGSIDQASEGFIDSSLKQAVIVYGTARAINATVSILQTFDLPGIGLGVGQGLDPLNSIVERFSTVMEIAIGSLVIQKTLIEITTAKLFDILLTIAAVPILISIFFRKNLNFNLPLKIFISFAFLRFALIISLVLNGLVSSYFIKDKILSEANIITQASTEASSDINEHKEAKETIKEIERQIPIIDGSSPSTTSQNPNLVPTPTNNGLWIKMKRLFGSSDSTSTQPPPIDGSAQVSNLQKLKDWLLKQKQNVATVLDNFNPIKIAAKIEKVVGNILNLMAIVLLQTLILPIFFMFLMKWIAQIIWNVRFDDFDANLKLR